MASAAAVLAGCSNYVAPKTNIYPGNPEEDFSPSLVKDNSYRNLALLRPAFASSSYDYNLTAQLAVDGILPGEAEGCPYITLCTPEGPVAKNEREWIFDEKITTHLDLKGAKTSLTLGFHNYSPAFDKMQLVGMAVPQGTPWAIELQASDDGAEWTAVERKLGRGIINQDFSAPGDHKYWRFELSAGKDCGWMITDWDFYNEGLDLEPAESRVEVYRREHLLQVLPQTSFTSAWMSAEGGYQWIYVDLGTPCSINGVQPLWLGCSPEGKIQISDDASHWADAADLSGSDSVELKAEARYVRLLLSGSDKPYALAELKVMGKGGLKPVAKPQPAPAGRDLALSGGNWRLQRASEVNATPEELSSASFDDSAWLPATVPGTVLSSYINAGALPDPNYSDNQLQISESFFDSDFWYRNTFTVPSSWKGSRLLLDFDGINWKAEVYANGKVAGRIDGAFTRARFDLTDVLCPGKVNTLAVRIIKNAHPGAVKEQTALSADGNGGVLGGDNPTFHASIGWDWIPTIRGRNIGIWNDVRLIARGPVTIGDPLVEPVLNLPDTTRATVRLAVDLSNLSASPVEGVLKGSFGELTFGKEVSLAAGESRTVELDPLQIENPRLWWPCGYGEQYLYDVVFSFETEGGESDSKTLRSGIRQMSWNEDGGILTLFVNGRRFVGRGGNWGFAESNLNYRGREYDAAVHYHADMNFTMIRNWVGQIGDEEFYDACDRYGVMVWQDFWLANPWDGPDPYDEDMFTANARDYVRRIRNHPSIGLYCGRNEGDPTPTLDAAFREIVASEGAGVHYTPNSASGVVSGGGPYRALPVEDYFHMRGADRFHSERGMPNVMNVENLRRTIPEPALWPQSSQWGLHDYTMESAQSASTFNAMLEKAFGPVGSVEEFCSLAQWINYDGYRAMFEGRSDGRRGLLLWMSHPAWPSMVWQTYDYYFEPTAAYFGCKKACEPLHIQYNAWTRKVEVVNVSAGSGLSLEAGAEVCDISGKPVWNRSVSLTSDEDSTVECFPVELPEDISDVYYLRLSLSGDGSGSNFYCLGKEPGNLKALRSLPSAEINSVTVFTPDGDSWVGETRLENNTTVPALMIRLKLTAGGELVTPVLYSDNYISLMPGQKCTVTTRFKDADRHGLRPLIEVESFNSAD